MFLILFYLFFIFPLFAVLKISWCFSYPSFPIQLNILCHRKYNMLLNRKKLVLCSFLLLFKMSGTFYMPFCNVTQSCIYNKYFNMRLFRNSMFYEKITKNRLTCKPLKISIYKIVPNLICFRVISLKNFSTSQSTNLIFPLFEPVIYKLFSKLSVKLPLHGKMNQNIVLHSFILKVPFFIQIAVAFLVQKKNAKIGSIFYPKHSKFQKFLFLISIF